MGKWWHQLACIIVKESLRRLNLKGDSWYRKMKANWEERDRFRQAETGTEKRIDDYTMAADAWLDFLEEYETEEKEKAMEKKRRDDDRAAGELTRENMMKPLSQKKRNVDKQSDTSSELRVNRSATEFMREDDNEDSEDMLYINNGHRDSSGLSLNHQKAVAIPS